MRLLLLLGILSLTNISIAQSWEDVGGGTNNSSHAMLTWNGYLVNLGSFNNPCQRVALWDGTSWSCLGTANMGQVARAGVVWNGNLVVVGDFWNTQQPCVGCNGVAMWDDVNQVWTPLGNGVNNDVLCVTVYNGDLIIGGDFTQASGVPSSRVVRYNEVTDTWESIGAVTDFDNDVRCMTVFDGELWVGGDFNNVGGNSPSDGVVKWDESLGQWVGGNSGVDIVGGVNETIRVLYVNPNDGNLYMGGHFTEIHDGDAAAPDPNMSGIAMYDGSNWYPLGTGLNDYVRAIYEYNGNLIAGGYFTVAGGVSAQKIARWNGSAWSAMGGGFDGSGIDEYVKSAMTWNGIFFAGGAYTQAEGGPMNYIAQWYEAPTVSPIASINASSNTTCTGQCIYFQDQSTGNPTTWNWSFPGADNPTSSLQHPGDVCYSTPGNYIATLEACNTNGCTTDQFTIVVSNAPQVTATDVGSCDGQTVTLSATPSATGGTYLWSPTNETTATIVVNPSSTSDYTVTYTLNGCSGSDVATVTVSTTPNVLVADDVICAGESAVLTAVPDIGGGDYNWLASGETTASITVSPTSSTTYTLEYTLNGCTSSASSVVTVHETFNSSENVMVCPNTIHIYPDGTNEMITGPSTHTSVLSSQFGCDSIVFTNVSLYPEYSVSEQETVCSGSSYTYPDGFVSSNITTNESHTSLLSSSNGCDSVIVTTLNVVANFQNSENVSVCSGSSYIYPDGTVSTGITTNESHTSVLTSQSGCDSIIVTNLAVDPIYQETINVSLCSGESYTYPDGTIENNITSNQSHVSAFQTVNGCDSLVTTMINISPLPSADVVLTGNTINAVETGANYQWLDCDNAFSPIAGETGQSYSPASSGNYAVEVTNQNGCVATSACEEVQLVGILELSAGDITIYPNPTNDFISFKIDNGDITYYLFDINGKILDHGILNNGDRIEVDHLESGVYILKANEVLFRVSKI
ncbi:MAG: T9SS type A sorting domain-containing protein [Bacteroidetes bacterium]|nr:MAG: T9SS type A sorting domain-containing protein [Bacteroidota bacterium]